MSNESAKQIIGIEHKEGEYTDWATALGVYSTEDKKGVEAKDVPLSKALSGKSVRNQTLFFQNDKVSEGRFVSVNAIPLKDHNGKVYACVQTFRDINEQVLLEKGLKRQLDFEQIVSSISAHFVGIPVGEIDIALGHALKRLCLYAGGRRAALYFIDQVEGYFENTHEWCEEPSDSLIAKAKKIDISTWGYVYNKLSEAEVVVFEKASDIPGEALGERKNGFPILDLGLVSWFHSKIQNRCEVFFALLGHPTKKRFGHNPF